MMKKLFGVSYLYEVETCGEFETRRAYVHTVAESGEQAIATVKEKAKEEVGEENYYDSFKADEICEVDGFKIVVEQ